MTVMVNAGAHARGEWNYSAVLVSLVGAVIVQGIALPCLSYQGTVNMYIAGAVDAIVVLRLLVARLFREQGRGWVFYAILPYLIVPAILLIEHFGFIGSRA